MPAKRKLTMRHLRQLLRLDHEGLSDCEIGRTLGVARSTIQDSLKRAKAAGIAWPLSSDLTDEVLEKRLFARPSVGNLRLGASPSVRLHGKGNKLRICPLWPKTATSLSRLVVERD